MVSVNRQIVEAILATSSRRAMFTAADIASYANLEGAETSIRKVLQRQYDGLLNLGSLVCEGSDEDRYISQVNVERWWVRQTLRWADSGLCNLTERQLASGMSLAFDEFRWLAPPEAILQVGRRWAIVAEGCVPGTFVFPWASVLHANPQLSETFISILDPQSELTWFKNELEGSYQQFQWQRLRDDNAPVQLGQSAIIAAADEALNTLRDRQANVIRSRFGFDTGQKATLEKLGLETGVTRERIRQIEKKALKKLRDLPPWHYGFAVHFILSGGSLLIPESEITPQWELLSASIGLNAESIPELGLRVLGAANGLPGYHDYLDRDHAISNVADEGSGNQVFKELWFLPRKDAMRLRAAEQEYRERQQKNREQEAIRTRPRMAFQALRSLGKAAHFQEIAEECNRLFPDRQCSIHSWHESLLRPEALALGIVWIGKKGIYGLEEQGYSRPIRDIFDAVASIVEARFAHTGQPVPFDFVMRQLSIERQDPDFNSVNIALSINERLASKGNGRYVPKTQVRTNTTTTTVPYDLEAGFDAFLSGADHGESR